MELVTKRDMDDAKALGERAGLEHFDDFDAFIHDIAQAIADGRRATAPIIQADDADAGARLAYEHDADNHPTIHSNRFAAWSELSESQKDVWRKRVPICR